jgi:dienelactone hydrolase
MIAINVLPDALLDAPFALRIEGLEPGAPIRVSVRAESLKAQAVAEFIADGAGSVDVAAHAPYAGDYEGVDAAGLLWSARFDEGADLISMLATLTTVAPLAYSVAVESARTEISHTVFTRRLMADDVQRTEVHDGRVRGTLFVRKGARAAPPVVVLGGSDGGNNFTFVGALLAAHGFAALSLGYFAYQDLPADLVELPLEYFAEAIAWLQSRPEVAGARVGTLGMSRGGELALLLGATYPEVAAVAALVPSGVSLGGIGKDPAMMSRAAWTCAGEALPFLPPPMDAESMQAVQRAFGERVPYAGTPGFERLLARSPELVERAAIPVERTRGAILLVSAQDDQIWPSSALAEVAMQRLRNLRFAYPFEHVSYPGAGHWACLPPNLPTTRNWSLHPLVPLPLAYGGNARDTATAAAAGWLRVVSFLRRKMTSG